MKQLSLCVLLSVILFACNKKESVTANPTETVAPLLIKAILIDPSLLAPNDTVTTYNIDYDAQNRPVILKYQDLENRVVQYSFVTKFEYNGMDTFASRTISNYFNIGYSPSNDTIYYKYVNEKCTLDSTRGIDPNGNKYIYSENYNYAGDLIYRKMQSINYNNYNIGGSSTIHQIKAGDKVTYQIDTFGFYFLTNPSVVSKQIVENHASYIPNPNPFYYLTKVTKREFLYDDIGIGSNYGFKTLLSHIDVKITAPGSPTSNVHTADYSYTFRADGYPSIAMENGIKIIFVYK